MKRTDERGLGVGFWAKFCALGAVALGGWLALISAPYFYLDLAGKRAWRQTEVRLMERGEPMTLAEIEPAPVADEDNLAAAPVFAELFVLPMGEGRLAGLENFRGVSREGVSEMVAFARKVESDFGGTDREAAAVVLATVAGEDPVWSEVRAAAGRSDVKWPVEYGDGVFMELPPLVPMLRLAQSLDVQAKARLVLGDAAAALADVNLMVNLANRIQEPPLLILHLVRISMLSILVDSVAFGIERGAWTDEQLTELQEILERIDLLADVRTTLRGERVISLLETGRDQAKDLRESAAVMGDDPNLLAAAAVLDWDWIRPRGLELEDRARWSELIQEMIDGAAAPAEWPVRAGALEAALARDRADTIRFFRTPMSLIGFPTVLPILQRTMHFQARIDLAIVACAIERFRLREGRWPDRLGELEGEIPVDLMSGEEFQYRREDEGAGGLLLYSVGWNQVDDGGSFEMPTAHAFADAEDWVWGRR